jgi:hypothetical protein
MSRLVVLSLLVFLSACAAPPKSAPSVPGAPASIQPSVMYRWWQARFHINWPADVPPRWYVDSLVANEVVGPVLRKHPSEIPLWRFHRRAVRDDAGHRFSWIFYASPEMASVYFDEISENIVLKHLVEKSVVSRVRLDTVTGGAPQPVGATADPRWSEVMQNAWPYYIHGISRMWLDMIASEETAMAAKPAPDNVDALIERYRIVEADIGGVWQTEGRHALLHHLNAIFGYQPLEFIERRKIRF